LPCAVQKANSFLQTQQTLHEAVASVESVSVGQRSDGLLWEYKEGAGALQAMETAIPFCHAENPFRSASFFLRFISIRFALANFSCRCARVSPIKRRRRRIREIALN